MKKRILIAGGTGLIGKQLTQHLRSKGHKVDILTRNPKNADEFRWDPQIGVLDYPYLSEVQILINLSGAGIADSRWTKARKKELIDSRVGTNHFLYSRVDEMNSLEQFICSSGISAYGYSTDDKLFTESDPFGDDFVSQLVRSWEESANLFQSKYRVCKIRTAVVLSREGGALKRMLTPIQFGIGSALGNGRQIMSWIHSDDLIALFEHCINQQLEGPFNAVGGNVSNAEFMRTLATVTNKPFFFPNVPAFALKMVFGEMSDLLLKGAAASNQKICSTGFKFNHTDLKSAISAILA